MTKRTAVTSKKTVIARGKSAYAEAGVDIDSKMNGIQSIKKMVAGTQTAGVIGGIGSFGGLFESPGKDHMLVSSADGVGTKLKVAVLAGKHDTVGQDLVNHCVNDILVQGAKPLFFMDYIGTARFDTEIFHNVIKGLCIACKQNGCALLGGETAELPGLYPPGEYDLVGTIVGSVKKSQIITGEKIQPGDILIGLPSGGLQTNGFSLARKVLFETCGLAPHDPFPGSKQSVAEVLLAVHKSFLKPISALLDAKIPIPGMAHITGGGFYDNIPRVLPKGCGATIDRSTWTTPPVFEFIQREGKVDADEMYRVFNMGIGYVIILREKNVTAAMQILKKMRQAPVVVGAITKGQNTVACIN